MPYKDKAARDAYDKSYREANRDKIAAQKKAYYLANKEKIISYGEAWREANPEKFAAYKKAYYGNNKEKLLAKSKAWAKANPEKHAAQKKAYRKADPGKIAAYRKAYYENNKEKAAVYGKAWAKANPEKVAAKSQNRRARKKDAGGSFIPEQIDEMLIAQGHMCRVCGTPITKPGNDKGCFHVDHKIALVNGGSNCISNIQLLCPSCNLSKGTHDMKEWMQRFDDFAVEM